MRLNKLFRFIVVCSLIFGSSCKDFTYEGKGNDIPTAGTITIGFEKGDSFMVMQWLEIFKSQYPKSNIIPVFKEKEELVSMVLRDSLHGVIIHDSFVESEINWLSERKNATVNKVLLGYTAPVFIVSNQNNLIGVDWGNYKCFQEAGIEKLLIRSAVCSEEQQIQKYLKTQIPDSSKFKQHFYPLFRREKLPTDKEIIEYVSNNPNTIGLISLNSIADKKDSQSLAFQKMVRVVPVKDKDGIFQLPFQSQLKTRQYPLIQPVVSYEMQGYGGLIKGFIIYANSQSGQALMQKSGLLPANHQGRKIQIDISGE